mgnify:CR=1 FL=1
MQITLFAKLFAFLMLAIFATYMEAVITIGKRRKVITFSWDLTLTLINYENKMSVIFIQFY